MTQTILNGLVLAGGESRRMGRDKAALEVDGRSALERAVALLEEHCVRTFVSVRAGSDDGLRAGFARIEDRFGGIGPADGIASAQAADPAAAWLVLACDLPQLDSGTLATLIAQRDPESDATAFRSVHDPVLPEPLCAIYEPSSRALVQDFLQGGMRCPRKMLLQMNTKLLDLASTTALDNVNTPEDWARYTAASGRQA